VEEHGLMNWSAIRGSCRNERTQHIADQRHNVDQLGTRNWREPIRPDERATLAASPRGFLRRVSALVPRTIGSAATTVN
jgi:hypothetical protein